MLKQLRELVDSIAKDDETRQTYLYNLANAYQMLYERTHAPDALLPSILASEEAIELAKDGESRATFLNALGTSLRMRFEATGNQQDIVLSSAVNRP